MIPKPDLALVIATNPGEFHRALKWIHQVTPGLRAGDPKNPVVDHMRPTAISWRRNFQVSAAGASKARTMMEFARQVKLPRQQEEVSTRTLLRMSPVLDITTSEDAESAKRRAKQMRQYATRLANPMRDDHIAWVLSHYQGKSQMAPPINVTQRIAREILETFLSRGRSLQT